MVLAILADTHMPRGSRRLPDPCVERLRGADLIVHAGDFCTAEIVREIEDHGPLAAVHGNVDDAELRDALPQTRMIDAGAARLALVHDAGPAVGRLTRMCRRFPDADAAIFGHSHIPLHERDEHGFQIFNPGSPTERRRAPRHTMGMATVRGDHIEFELVSLD